MNPKKLLPSVAGTTSYMLAVVFSSGSAIAQVTEANPADPGIPGESLALPSVEPAAPFPEADASISGYILGPGDQINFAVIDLPEFTQTQVVLPDGTILVPLIGSVQASGETLQTLQAAITRRLSVFLVDPVVELSLFTLRPVLVTISGEVNRPGPLQLDSLTDTGASVPTLSTALARAGGVRRTADLQDITIQRRLPGNRQTQLTINLWESVFQGVQGDDILLQDGDMIFVPRALADAEIDPRLVARSSLAPEFIRIRVIGEVGSPGDVEVSPDSIVLDVLAAAGGHNSDASLRNVALLRLNETGQLEGQNLNLKGLSDTTPVQNGDIIVVPRKGYLNVVDAVARTLQPITAPFNFFLLLDNVLLGDE